MARLPRSDYDIEVDDDPEHLKFEASLNEDAVADLHYTFVGERMVLLHTVVRYAYRGHGIATELISKALDDIRTTGRKITVECPIVRAFIDQYPEYEDLVDPAHPGLDSQRATNPDADAMADAESVDPAADDEVTVFEESLGDDDADDDPIA
jgi:predicted GNAT family acetyltransferase